MVQVESTVVIFNNQTLKPGAFKSKGQFAPPYLIGAPLGGMISPARGATVYVAASLTEGTSAFVPMPAEVAAVDVVAVGVVDVVGVDVVVVDVIIGVWRRRWCWCRDRW